MNLLQVNNVTKKYAQHVALNNVSLSVKAGEIFGLLGPNGAGKTSLIRIINQITAPDAGTILFNNEPLNTKHISLIGYLPEERGLYKKMEVGEQALYLAQLKGLSKHDAKQKLKYWFEKFEIQSWWNKKVEDLSKGMAQKVQFIVTVLHNPMLLILDEPFSGFDPINANQIKNEILNLRNNGSTVIFSTHNMGSVEELCDSIALINQSKKILEGPVDEIKNKYKENIYQITFKGNVIGFTNALWTSAVMVENPINKGNLTTAKIKLSEKVSINDVLLAIIPFVEIVKLEEYSPSMNDIFIKLVGKENNSFASATNNNHHTE
jgi:ABC-2 type transport system ATP-binding protein